MPNFLSESAIDSYYKGMKEPVNAEITQAGNDYKAALERLQQMKEQQDAENYRSYVRQQTEIPGLMRASGNNGGMVDSAVASLANAYNQARAKRSMEYEGNRANQDLDYNNRLAELRAKLAQYDQLAAADKANLLAQQEAEAAAAAARSYRGRSGGSGNGYGEDVTDEWAMRNTDPVISTQNTIPQKPSGAITTDIGGGAGTNNNTSRLRNEPSLYDKGTTTSSGGTTTSRSSTSTKRLPSLRD